jgi:hypothetical protein
MCNTVLGFWTELPFASFMAEEFSQVFRAPVCRSHGAAQVSMLLAAASDAGKAMCRLQEMPRLARFAAESVTTFQVNLRQLQCL